MGVPVVALPTTAEATTISGQLSAPPDGASNASGAPNDLAASRRHHQLKQQMHLELNVVGAASVENDDIANVRTMAAGAGVRGDGLIVETVTTVPQQHRANDAKITTTTTTTTTSRAAATATGKAFEVTTIGAGAVAAVAATAKAKAAAATTAAANRKTTTITGGGEGGAAAASLPFPLSSPSSSSLSSSSLLKSSPTALAKFNRIIDSTVPVTNCYTHVAGPQQQQQHVAAAAPSASATTTLSSSLQQRLALAYPDIVAHDSMTDLKINFTNTITTKLGMAPAAGAVDGASSPPSSAPASKPTLTPTPAAGARATNDDNQMKRNDVHYLLKQLNSFSDIEEIEIVGMKQRQQPHTHTQQQQQSPAQQQALQYDMQYHYHHEQSQQQASSSSPTATSLVLVSPSSLSHKGIRRYASLHQQQSHHPLMGSGVGGGGAGGHCGYGLDGAERVGSANAVGHYGHADRHYHHQQQQQHGQQQQQQQQYDHEQHQYMLQQFDDYIFESCHYLETNYFAANYRTAMVESSSHEFRPSTSTTGTAATPAGGALSSVESLSLQTPGGQHDIEPPSVIYRGPLPQPSPAAAALTGPASMEASASMQRFHMQTRMTSSGVQTELTAISLSTAATNCSLAASGTTSSSNSSADRRRPPFFKCCYTPIDRWRERRDAASPKRKGSRRHGGAETFGAGGGGDSIADGSASVDVIELAVCEVGSSHHRHRHRSHPEAAAAQQKHQQHTHTHTHKKNGHAV